MTHWIFISNPNQFRMNDCLNECGFVEYLQRNKVCVGDIVFLYSTAPIQRIEYKMVVERTDILFEESYDDRRFASDVNNRATHRGDKFFRLQLIKGVESSKLSLVSLRNHGLKSSMQGPLKVSGHLLDYIEEQFSCK